MLHKREALCFNDKDEEMFIRGKLLGFCLILYMSFMNAETQQRRKKQSLRPTMQLFSGL